LIEVCQEFGYLLIGVLLIWLHQIFDQSLDALYRACHLLHRAAKKSSEFLIIELYSPGTGAKAITL
jgi:hypothetical protein